jgi:hypothetical protein
VIQFREVSDPVDRALASACLLNDAGDFYFRLIGHRLDGEAGIALPARSQPFEQQLQRVWDRSRDCSELRALGIWRQPPNLSGTGTGGRGMPVVVPFVSGWGYNLAV